MCVLIVVDGECFGMVFNIVIGFLCVSDNESNANILGRLQGMESGLIRVHEHNRSIVKVGKCECLS